MTPPALEAIGVGRTYGNGDLRVPVLRSVDLRVEPGEFVAIVGRSGAGKSTLLQVLGLLDVPDAGELLVNGTDASSLSDAERSRLRGREIGFVFQAFNLLPDYDALDNIAIAGTVGGMRRSAARARALELLDQVGLAHRHHHRATELSGGENQRVAIGRALINDPAILLADEPTGNLDSEAGEQVIELLAQLHSTQRRTLVVVTHDQVVADRADRTVHLADGVMGLERFVGSDR